MRPGRLAVGVGAVALLSGALAVGLPSPLHTGPPASAVHTLGAAPAPATGPTTPPAPVGVDPAVAARSADAAVAALTSGRPADSVSIAALDTATGARYSWGPSSGMTAASVAKLLLLESALLHEQDRGQAPGGDQAGAQTLMIENSDNDAGDAVFADQGGSSGFRETVQRLGLSGTALGPLGQWGLSTTSAGDQLVLLDDLVSASSPLSADSRAFALHLMGSVEPDQRWGVGAAADPSTPFANKNGWLPVDDDGGRWAVTSVGIITVHGHQVLMSVLTQHDAGLDVGTALVESLARAAATAVVPGG